jgi:hypothetical protein
MRISYQRVTHAYIHRMYSGGDFVEVGDQGEYGRVDPDTGYPFKAIADRDDHCYSTDFKVSSSYPKTGFYLGEGQYTHDDIKSALKAHNLFSNNILNPVIVCYGPRSRIPAFQYSPPERAMRFREMKKSLERNGIEYQEFGESINFELEAEAVA